MGNCFRKGSSVQWGGEDWSSFGSGRKTRYNGDEETKENKNLIGESKEEYLSAGTEIKIKVSKKQLEKLLRKADDEGLTAKQVLTQLMDGGDQFEAHRRSWSPDLLSIPE